MKICVACWILGALTACSTAPPEVPDCQIPSVRADATYPLSLPELPVEASSTLTTATFDLDGMRQLKAYRIASETNTTIAGDNAAAFEARNESVNELIECARYANVWMLLQADDLQTEKREHFIDNLWHRGFILILGIGLAL